MGDRVSIAIRETQKKQVWLYGHWSGTEAPETVRKALANAWCWRDAPYLARIVLEELVGDRRGTETGFGIWCEPCDYEYPFLIIDVTKQEVYLEQPPNNWIKLSEPKTYSFKDYVALDEATWSHLDLGRDKDDE